VFRHANSRATKLDASGAVPVAFGDHPLENGDISARLQTRPTSEVIRDLVPGLGALNGQDWIPLAEAAPRRAGSRGSKLISASPFAELARRLALA